MEAAIIAILLTVIAGLVCSLHTKWTNLIDVRAKLRIAESNSSVDRLAVELAQQRIREFKRELMVIRDDCCEAFINTSDEDAQLAHFKCQKLLERG